LEIAEAGEENHENERVCSSAEKSAAVGGETAKKFCAEEYRGGRVWLNGGRRRKRP